MLIINCWIIICTAKKNAQKNWQFQNSGKKSWGKKKWGKKKLRVKKNGGKRKVVVKKMWVEKKVGVKKKWGWKKSVVKISGVKKCREKVVKKKFG